MRKRHEVREGQIVRIIDGPLTGFRGEVKEVDEQTAKVAVQVFGRDTPMDLTLGQIELVPENSNWGMSALPPKADMCGATKDVCFGPIADIDVITGKSP